jgi:hypothetical protein
MTMMLDADMKATMGTRWKQVLWTMIAIVVTGALAAAAFIYMQRATTAPDSIAPTTVGRMTLKAQFAGPLKDTVVQRWEDPATGNNCYIYLPVVVQHSAPTPTGFVQYGPNGIGSISCLPR